MAKKNISQEKIIQAFINCAFEKSAGATSLSDIAENLEIKKASLYNHFDSRDSMYSASIEYCAREIGAVNFLPEQQLQTINDTKNTLDEMFRYLISRFFQLYESEPLFEMYSFINTEKYFNNNALKIIETENQLILNDVKNTINAFSKAGKIKGKTEEEINEGANLISAIIIQQRDFCLACRKEIVRQNPDSGAGSLFALPEDDEGIKAACHIVGICVENFFH